MKSSVNVKSGTGLRKIENTLPPPSPKAASKEPKDVWQSFAALPTDEKITVFEAIKSEMSQAFELAFKQSEERACFLKQSFDRLMKG